MHDARWRRVAREQVDALDDRARSPSPRPDLHVPGHPGHTNAADLRIDRRRSEAPERAPQRGIEMKAPASETTATETQLLDEALLDRAHQHAADYLRSMTTRHVGARATHDELLRGLSVPLPEHGDDPAKVIDVLASQAERGAIGSAGPRYFGFVIGGGLPVTVAADWLTTVWDQNAGIFVTSPLASVTEEVTRHWLLDLFGLPKDAGLGFTTGCQMA